MNSSEIVLGIDVGNNDTKGSYISIPSGFAVQKRQGMALNNEYMIYNGKYYVSVNDRFPYVKDKTVDDHMYVLTLIGIVKDMEAMFTDLSPDERRHRIADIKTVHLGVGLPPTHMSMLSQSYVDYYRIMSGNKPIQITYNGNDYEFDFGKIKAYPQNYAAIATYQMPEDSLLKKYDTYRMVDIGGYTVDVVSMVPNTEGTGSKPDPKDSFSLELGINKFIESMIPIIDRETGLTLQRMVIVDILMGRPTALDDSVKSMVLDYAEDWTNDMLNTVANEGVNFKAYPTLFMGGGSMLLMPYIKKSPVLGLTEMLPGTKRNANAYRKLLTLEIERERGGMR